MKCDYCGYDNKPGVKYCAFCGVETTFYKEPVQQKSDSEYEKYKEQQKKQERRKHWEQIFQTRQTPVPSNQEPSAWKQEKNQTNHLPKNNEKSDRSLNYRIKHMPVWLKFIFIFLIFTQPAAAVFWFFAWLIYDQFQHK